MSTNAHQARETIKAEKRSGTLLNGSGRSPTKAAIFLDNGSVVASPLSVTRLLSSIERANERMETAKRTNNSKHIKVYDYIKDDPEDNEEDFVLDEEDSDAEEEENIDTDISPE